MFFTMARESAMRCGEGCLDQGLPVWVMVTIVYSTEHSLLNGHQPCPQHSHGIHGIHLPDGGTTLAHSPYSTATNDTRQTNKQTTQLRRSLRSPRRSDYGTVETVSPRNRTAPGSSPSPTLAIEQTCTPSGRGPGCETRQSTAV